MAILKDYSNVWDSEVDVWHGRVDSFSDNSWFEATQLTHTPCDFFYLRPQTVLQDLLAYELLVCPHPAIIEPKIADLLKEYVENGGTLIFGARAGYKDEFGRCPMRSMPGIISEWCGVTVTDYTLVGPADGEINVELDGRPINAPVFSEVLKTNDDTTEILANFRGNYYDGQPALCRKALGKGHVYYFGACFSVEIAKALLEKTNQISPYQQLLELPEAVELAVRTDGETDFLFILNYKDITTNIKLNQALPELISGEVIEGLITLKPYDVKIIKFEKAIGKS